MSLDCSVNDVSNLYQSGPLCESGLDLCKLIAMLNIKG